MLFQLGRKAMVRWPPAQSVDHHTVLLPLHAPEQLTYPSFCHLHARPLLSA
jgi:hypothetical protein